VSQDRYAIGAWFYEKTAAAEPSEKTGTLNVHSQEVRFRRGEAFDLTVTMTGNTDSVRAVFSVRLGSGATTSGDQEEDYLIKKTSYDGGSDLVSRGKAVVSITRGDTINHPYGEGYRWQLEMSSARNRVSAMAPAKVLPVAGSNLVFGRELAALAKVGQLITIGDKTGAIISVLNGVVATDRNDWGKLQGTASLQDAEVSVVASGPWVCVF